MEDKNFYTEKEIFKIVDLCDEAGQLNSDCIGWSRHPVHNCDIPGRWLRRKKWNYWCLYNKECLFSVTIANLDYAGMVFIYFLDFKTNKFIEKTITTPFGRGCVMPNIVHETVNFNHSKIEIEMAERLDNTHIVVKCPDFDGLALEANFRAMYADGHETLNVIIPWNKRTFQFTSKHMCLPVQGNLKLGALTYDFNPEDTFACLDYGRGIWPRQSSWNWATISGVADGRRLGLNLGAKWTTGTGMTENAIVLDGKLTKISEEVIFDYDRTNFMKPWIIKTDITNRINLTITPFYERIACSNLLFINSELHQIVGHVNGRIITEEGETIEIRDMIGCTEDHYAKW